MLLNVLDIFMPSTFWEQVGGGAFLFGHDCAPVHKTRSTWMREFGEEILISTL